MSASNNNRGLSYKTVLKSTAVAGLAAVLLSSGLPARINEGEVSAAVLLVAAKLAAALILAAAVAG